MLAFTVLAFGVLAALTGCDDDPTEEPTTPAAAASPSTTSSSAPSVTPQRVDRRSR